MAENKNIQLKDPSNGNLLFPKTNSEIVSFNESTVKVELERLETAKVDKVTGKGLSTEDFTTELKTKLEGIEAEAEVNIIEGVQVNGTDLVPDENRKVNVVIPDAAEYSIAKASTAESGFAATYNLTKDGTNVGASINIPLDYLVKSAVVKTWDGTGTAPVEGMVSGDKYIDFTVNAKEGTGTESHLYIAIKDMVSAYSAGNGLSLSADNKFSINLTTDKGLELTGTDGSQTLGVKYDDSTLGINSTSKALEVKDGGVTFAKFANSAIAETIATVGSSDKIPTEEAVADALGDKQDTITAGAGLTFDATDTAKLKHSNSVTAETSGKIGFVKYDTEGHVTGIEDGIGKGSNGQTLVLNDNTLEWGTYYSPDTTTIESYTSDNDTYIRVKDEGITFAKFNSGAIVDSNTGIAETSASDEKLPTEAAVRSALNKKQDNISVRKGLEFKYDSTDQVTYLQHKNEVTAETSGKIGLLKYDTEGHVTALDSGVGLGTAGQILKTNSAGTGLEWGDTAEVSVDGVTIGTNAAGQLIVKDGGLTVNKFHTNSVATVIPTSDPVQSRLTTEKAVFDALALKQDTITAGTGLSLASDNKTINHSNSITEETTGKLGLVKYDGQGHITGIDERPLVTAWSATVADTNVPSEKLVKDSLDTKLENVKIGTTALTVTDKAVTIPNFVGATSTANGTAGLVPAPVIADNTDNKFLSADGSWKFLPIIYEVI